MEGEGRVKRRGTVRSELERKAGIVLRRRTRNRRLRKRQRMKGSECVEKWMRRGNLRKEEREGRTRSKEKKKKVRDQPKDKSGMTSPQSFSSLSHLKSEHKYPDHTN